MASPCLGCGTTTDANGDLTILGARSSAWKTRYGPDIDASNGLRCDPATGKLWVAPPNKINTWTIGPGTWDSDIVDTSSFEARSVWVGEARAIGRVPAGGEPTGPSATITPSRRDPDVWSTRQYVSTGSTLNWTNSTAEEQLITVTTTARLGAGTLYAGGILVPARGMAGIETRVNINNAGFVYRTIEHGVYHGSTLDETLQNHLPFYSTFSNCSRTDIFTVEAGQTLQVVMKPYFRSQFGDTGAMIFMFDRSPLITVRAESLFRHADNLDAA
jgi:hypothetical protein